MHKDRKTHKGTKSNIYSDNTNILRRPTGHNQRLSTPSEPYRSTWPPQVGAGAGAGSILGTMYARVTWRTVAPTRIPFAVRTTELDIHTRCAIFPRTRTRMSTPPLSGSSQLQPPMRPLNIVSLCWHWGEMGLRALHSHDFVGFADWVEGNVLNMNGLWVVNNFCAMTSQFKLWPSCSTLSMEIGEGEIWSSVTIRV